MKQIITKPLTLRRTCAASILTTLFLLFAGYTSGWAETHEVDNGGDLEFWLNNAQNGDIIKVKDNIEVYYNISFNNTVTLDLNGKTINFDHQFPINGGKLTIEGPGIIDVSPIEINGGELILNSGTISSDRNESIYLKSGSVTVNGGSVISTNNVALHIIGGTFTVNGGSVISTSGAALNLAGGTCTITGGQIGDEGKPGLNVVNNATASITGGTVWMYDLNGTMTVSGGTVKGDFDLWDSGILNICAGATMECNITNWGGTVNIAADVAASVTVGNTTTYYAVLQDDDAETADAVSAALAAYVPASGETPAVVPIITLLKDVNDNYSLDFSTNNNEAAVIFDLNGMTISNTSIGNSISLTITDSKGGGEINSGSYENTIRNYGNLTIKGGMISGGEEGTIINGGTLILNGGSIVTIWRGIENEGSGLLTINGGTISAEGDPNNLDDPGTAILNYGTLTVSGGSIENSDIGIVSIDWSGSTIFSLTGLPTFSGNDIDISLDDAFITFNSNITTAPDQLIKLDVGYSSYPFTIGYSTYCTGIHPTQMFQYVGNSSDSFVALNPVSGEAERMLGLMDDSDNSSTLSGWHSNENIQLYGRTFYRNGDWNTLCLPFSMTATQIAASDLAGAEIKELDDDNSSLDNDGLLTLTFTPSSSIVAGKPYIVRWDKDKTENLANIINPVFTDVRISVTEPIPVPFDNAKGSDCQFVGQFSPFAINNANMNEIMMMGSGSTVGYSNSTRNLKCFRAHFVIPTTGNPLARQIRIDFNDKATSLDESVRLKTDDSEGAWYGLDGQRLSAEPKLKGVYIHNGKKVIIK